MKLLQCVNVNLSMLAWSSLKLDLERLLSTFATITEQMTENSNFPLKNKPHTSKELVHAKNV